MEQKILGIDIGTTGCKVALFGENGTVLSHFQKDYSTHHPFPGANEHSAQDWWDHACEGIRTVLSDAGADGRQISAIGLSCMAPVLLPLDGNGVPLDHAQIWSDRRGDSYLPEINQTIGPGRMESITGNSVKGGYMLPKLMWLKRNKPDVFQHARHFLQPNGYIALQLTGVYSMDTSVSEVTSMTDIADGQWSREICSAFGVGMDTLPPVIPANGIAGYTRDGLQSICGLPAGIPVVSGGHDSALSAFVLGIEQPGQSCLDIGNASNLIMCIDRPVRHMASDFYRHPLPGGWLFQIYSATTGAAFRWIGQILDPNKQGRVDYNSLCQQAEQSPAGANGLLFLPYLSGSQHRENACGLFYGLRLEHRQEDLIRSVLEGCAYSVRYNMDCMQQISQQDIKTIIVTGGGSANDVWVQIHADILEKPLLVRNVSNAAVMGAAMLARQTVMGKRYDADAILGTGRVVEPYAQNRSHYEDCYERFRQLMAV